MAASRLAGAFLLGCLAAWLSLRRADWGQVASVLQSARPAWLALALLSVLATSAAKGARWRILLRPCGPDLGLMRLTRVVLIGQLGNNLLPFRLGDAARAVLVGPSARGGAAATVGTLVAEKALDGTVGTLMLLGLAAARPLPGWLGRAALIVGAVTVTLVAGLGFAAQHARRAGSALPEVPLRARPGWQPRAHDLLCDLQLGLGTLRTPAQVAEALAWAAAVWGLGGITNLLVLGSLGIEASSSAPWLALVAVYMASLLPAAPAQMGLFEYACWLALTVTGVGSAPALAFGLALHAVVLLPAVILGWLGSAAEGVQWARIGQAGTRR